jgi:hypothetical protein
MDYGHTIDDWAEDTDDFCDACDDWSEDDGHGNCKSCGVAFKSVDPFLTPSVAKAYSSPAPTVSASGDLYGRGAGYTWGRGGSWWSSGVSAMTSMWGNNRLADSDKKVRMLKHKRHLDSLCKVVDPTVKHTLNYATDSSYSSINRGLIYVDGSLLEKDDDNLDIVAGLAIHEKLHLVHTKPLLKWESIYAQDNHLAGYQQGLLHNIGNIIEDEYIESQLAKTHAGFVSYIAKLKEHYFGKHGKKLEVEGNEFGEILNTLLAFVRYPSALSDDRKKKHGKHIQFFARALAPAYKSRENSLVAIQAIYEYMYQVAKDIAKKKGSDESVEELIDKKVSDRWDEIMDKWGGETALGDEEKTRMKDRLTEDIRADVEYDKRHLLRDLVHAGSKQMPSELADYTAGMDSISEHLDRTIKDLEDSDYSEEMWDKSKSLGLAKKTKVTWRNQRSNESSNYEYNDALSNMKSAIGQLKRRIQLFGNTNIHTIRNQRRGKLDKRMLHKIPLGRPDLFKNTIIDEDKPLDVCLLVDESGSMGTWKMKKARQTAIAIREALKDNQALNLWVFGHTADGYDWDAKGQTNMSCYWSPTHQTDIKAMGAMRARSENRDGVAILASAGRVQAESPSMGSNKLMIVISDGEPSADGYRYHQGVPHTKKAVSHLEGQGWSMIQIGISGARESAMREMFTNYVLVENMDNLSNTVSKVIRKVIKV